jgi:AcrR family transcriptional regulator
LTIASFPSARTAVTAETLLTTAERLYAERGIDAVSMREISRAAGQKNTSALQYHFINKEALIAAILKRRMLALDYRRLEFLEELERHDRLRDLRSLVLVMIKPMAESINSSKRLSGEDRYIGFLSEVQRHPEFDAVEIGKTASLIGLRRVYMLIGKQLHHLPDAVLRQRFNMAMSQVVHVLAEFERLRLRRRGSRRSFDVERAVENLIDMTAGALAATVSDEVARRLEA